MHVKSYWDGDESVCTWQPEPFHMAGPTHVLNGGIIASIIDCHCVCTAIAAAYQAEDRALDSAPPIWYATVSLQTSYMRPSPIESPVILRARLEEVAGRRTTLSCSLHSDGKERAHARLIAVRVPEEWRQGTPGPEM